MSYRKEFNKYCDDEGNIAYMQHHFDIATAKKTKMYVDTSKIKELDVWEKAYNKALEDVKEERIKGYYFKDN